MGFIFTSIHLLHLHGRLEGASKPFPWQRGYPPSLPSHCFTGILAVRAPGNPLLWSHMSQEPHARAMESAPLWGKDGEGFTKHHCQGCFKVCSRLGFCVDRFVFVAWGWVQKELMGMGSSSSWLLRVL